ncbi:MAG: N-acetyl-gamma-glutamyl-phosphate reductase [Clostridia bacterium]|nr:N-acetyl-gamma-glutamyl-phosphate reductase [Clostridia bacterium]
MIRVFIDGKEGTTGLRIWERLQGRNDIELITLTEDKRKDAAARKEAIHAADTVFLCLPDSAAKEAVELAKGSHARIIDASTAHRTNPLWDYGFAEISRKQREKIANSARVANPGCHASGFISLVRPLVDNGILAKDVLLTCHSVTGYSGGGKKMIAQYESAGDDLLLSSPRQYGIGQTHKHLPEMAALSGIENAPVFSPIVSNFYSGMEVTVPLFASQLCKGKTMEDIKEAYKALYNGPVVKYVEDGDEGGFLSATKLAGKDSMEISVYGNDDRIILVSRYDNLGKGASGAAVQCFNIMHGLDETLSLEL